MSVAQRKRCAVFSDQPDQYCPEILQEFAAQTLVTQVLATEKMQIKKVINASSVLPLKKHLAFSHARGIESLASHDVITHLYSRNILWLLLEITVSMRQRHDGRLALLLIELDDFSLLAQQLGNKISNEVMEEVAKRMTHCIHRSDLSARLAGDEFALVLKRVKNYMYAGEIADRICNVLSLPIHVAGHEIKLKVCIGISCYPVAGLQPDELLESAEQALKKSKQSGVIHFFSDVLDEEYYVRKPMKVGLRTAVYNGLFELLFEPQFDCLKHELVGVEADL